MSVSLKTDPFNLYPPKIQDGGVDWITCTQSGRRSGEHLMDVAEDILAEVAEAGNDVSYSSLQGYHGKRAGGVTYGVRYDGYIAQLRGSDARDNWQRLMPHISNVSRLDIQSTFEFPTAQRELMRVAFARAKRARFKAGRRPNFTLINSTVKGSTLNFGCRSSDIMGRMYDKGVESKQTAPGILIRQEVEYKRDAALNCARRLNASESHRTLAVQVACSEFRQRGIITSPLEIGEVENARAAAQSDDARRLSYIRRSTSKTVEKILRSYSVDDVLEALGLSAYAVSRTLMDDERKE